MRSLNRIWIEGQLEEQRDRIGKRITDCPYRMLTQYRTGKMPVRLQDCSGYSFLWQNHQS